MLQDRTYKATDAERERVDELAAEHGQPTGVSRRDPGEGGPLIVEIGARTWLVDETGGVEEVPS